MSDDDDSDGPDVCEEWGGALLDACEDGAVMDVARLLRRDRGSGARLANVTQHSFTPLICAARGGHLEVLRLLLEKGARVGAPGEDSAGGDVCCDTAVTVAAERLSKLESIAHSHPCREAELVVARLQEARVDPAVVESQGSTPGRLAESWAALAAAAGLYGQDRRLGVPVLRACVDEKRRAEYASDDGLLLTWGEGIEALLRAATQRQLEVARALLKAGAGADRRDHGGHTALMYAAEAGHVPLTEMLLGAGADPDIASAEGWTATMLAAARRGGSGLAVLGVCRRDGSGRGTPLLRGGGVAQRH
jgi:ankyrin repeat protein